jgi:carbonic anhydrase
MNPTNTGLPGGWRHTMTDVYHIYDEKLTVITDAAEPYRRLVELNVTEQFLNVAKAAYVLKSILDKKLIGTYGRVHDLHDGQLIDLEVNVRGMIIKNRDIRTKQRFLH